MSFPVMPIGAAGAGSASAVTGTGYLDLAALDPAQGLSSAQGTSSTSGAAFGSILTGAVENLQGAQQKSSALAVQAVSGDLDDVHDYTIAASQAAVTLELTAAVRNKAVEAFTEIMRMQA